MPKKKKKPIKIKKVIKKSSPPRRTIVTPRLDRGVSATKKPRFKKRNFLAQALIIVILAVGLFLGYAFFINSPISEKAEFNVPSGAAVSKISSELKSKNLINSEFLFRVSVHLWGGRIQTGLYDLRAGQSVWTIARDLSRGKIALTMVTIPEGLTVKQIYEIIGKHPGLTGELRILYNDGELLPETYGFAKGTDRNKVLTTMANKMTALREKYQENLPEPIKDWNQLVSLAAIIQKETSILSEMPRVSGVYVNRLKTGMKLQADPTVVYAITDGWGHMGGRAIYRKHLQIDSPYNTYMYRGLTPAPIANPGIHAIMAALSPEKHDYYFFVADGSGGHIFSKTYEEHKRNHENWREIRKNLNPNY